MVTGITYISSSASSFSFSDQGEPASLGRLSALIEDLPRKETTRTELNGHGFRRAGKQSKTLIKRNVTRAIYGHAVLALREIIERVSPILASDCAASARSADRIQAHIGRDDHFLRRPIDHTNC
jgi:hypothetical protein